jgi:futalosine hydrolase
MEGFAVAAACIMNNVPWVIVRGISNLAGDRVKSNWQTDGALHKAAEHVSRILAK